MARQCRDSLRSYLGRSVSRAMQVVVENGSWATALNVQATGWLFIGDRANPNSNATTEHSACLGNLIGDETEVSRRHSSQTPIVMVGTR